MTTQAEIEEFYLMTQMRARRRFLPVAPTPTGFQDDLAPIVTKRLEVGRKALIQIRDFEESK
jgi:hypothetical protein